jgi:hemerythrin
MEKFVWSEEYSVGIPSIDEQHKHFFGIANQIVDLAEQENPAREALFSAAEELGDYAMYHLKTEEDYFDKFSYAGETEHLEAHNLYRKRVAHYLDALQNPDSSAKELAGEMASYSIYWLSDHILFMDKKYGLFLGEHGVR